MSDIVERLIGYAGDDHERLCEGRRYTCSCGYDDKRDPLIEEAAAEITRLREEVERKDAENLRLRNEIADMANTINIEGSPYDQALKAIEAMMLSVKQRSRAAITPQQETQG